MTEQPEEEPAGAWQSALEDGTAGFVERLYRIVLGRPSDAAGKADWIQLLKSGEASGSEVAAGFFTSSEYQKSGKMDAAYVEDLYQAILEELMMKRESSPGFLCWRVESAGRESLRIYRFAGIYGTLPQLWNYMRQFCLGGAQRSECKGDGLCAATVSGSAWQRWRCERPE